MQSVVWLDKVKVYLENVEVIEFWKADETKNANIDCEGNWNWKGIYVVSCTMQDVHWLINTCNYNATMEHILNKLKPLKLYLIEVPITVT